MKPLISLANLHARIINELAREFKRAQDQINQAHADGKEADQIFVRVDVLALVNVESNVGGITLVSTVSDDFLTIAAADPLAGEIESALDVMVRAEQERQQNPLPFGGAENGQTQDPENDQTGNPGPGNSNSDMSNA